MDAIPQGIAADAIPRELVQQVRVTGEPILGRDVSWETAPVQSKVQWKYVRLVDGTRQERGSFGLDMNLSKQAAPSIPRAPFHKCRRRPRIHLAGKFGSGVPKTTNLTVRQSCKLRMLTVTHVNPHPQTGVNNVV